ncbi:MAG: FAD-dependent monooxygenase [Burkholderiaceae bacterium]
MSNAKSMIDVAIVGAGPVGLTLAMALARYGVRSTVFESRAEGEPTTVRCNHVSSRSMEVFRWLGIAAAVRDAGLPADHAHDVAFRSTAVAADFARIRIPGRAGRQRGEPGVDQDWPTPEPPHRVNQKYLEPVMVAAAHRVPALTLRYGCTVRTLDPGDDSVCLHVERSDGVVEQVDARYVVGCDGARSLVRQRMGARYEGDAVVQRVQSTVIEAPRLQALMASEPAWGTINLNPRRSGTLYAIDGERTWLVHNYLRPHETDFDAIDRMASIRTILGVGEDFAFEVVQNEDWIGRRLVVDKMREGRLFLAGDAAHIWVPYAGYGMNAGIADAMNLAWCLAARVNGWGGPGCLDAYAAERHPITEQVSRFAMRHAEQMIAKRGAVPSEIEDTGPAGDEARRSFGEHCVTLNVAQYACTGLNYGYFYTGSPIIAYDDGQAPAYSMDEYSPSTVPGCRLPDPWLGDGEPILDRLGAGYTVLRYDRDIDLDQGLRASSMYDLPISALDVERAAPEGWPLLIVRPDLHIVWRGKRLPGQGDRLWRILAGRDV